MATLVIIVDQSLHHSKISQLVRPLRKVETGLVSLLLTYNPLPPQIYDDLSDQLYISYSLQISFRLYRYILSNISNHTSALNQNIRSIATDLNDSTAIVVGEMIDRPSAHNPNSARPHQTKLILHTTNSYKTFCWLSETLEYQARVSPKKTHHSFSVTSVQRNTHSNHSTYQPSLGDRSNKSTEMLHDQNRQMHPATRQATQSSSAESK